MTAVKAPNSYSNRGTTDCRWGYVFSRSLRPSFVFDATIKCNFSATFVWFLCNKEKQLGATMSRKRSTSASPEPSCSKKLKVEEDPDNHSCDIIKLSDDVLLEIMKNLGSLDLFHLGQLVFFFIVFFSNGCLKCMFIVYNNCRFRQLGFETLI